VNVFWGLKRGWSVIGCELPNLVWGINREWVISVMQIEV